MYFKSNLKNLCHLAFFLVFELVIILFKDFNNNKIETILIRNVTLLF